MTLWWFMSSRDPDWYFCVCSMYRASRGSWIDFLCFFQTYGIKSLGLSKFGTLINQSFWIWGLSVSYKKVISCIELFVWYRKLQTSNFVQVGPRLLASEALGRRKCKFSVEEDNHILGTKLFLQFFFSNKFPVHSQDKNIQTEAKLYKQMPGEQIDNRNRPPRTFDVRTVFHRLQNTWYVQGDKSHAGKFQQGIENYKK